MLVNARRQLLGNDDVWRHAREVLPRASAFGSFDQEEPDGFGQQEEPERQQFTIVAEEQDNDSWQVTITVIPPPNGLLVLTFGTLRLVAPFAPDGTATISNIPSDVLVHPDGPEMEIGIAPVEHA